MKKLFLFLACFIINIENVRADEPLSAEVDTSQKIKLEVEKYKKECSKKAYPKNLDEINIYNDDLKKLDAKYHQCLKSVIVSKINDSVVKQDSRRHFKLLLEFI